jgi:hypothetical protein
MQGTLSQKRLGTFLAAALLTAMIGCQRTDARHSRRPAEMNSWPMLIADYQPWFGDHNHIDVGYNSQDPAVLQRQIDQAKSMGIGAFIVDWYGDRQPFLDKSYALLQRLASQTGFKVALMYDETHLDTEGATLDAIDSFDKAYRDYIQPGATGSDAYLTYNGRPLIFIFAKGGHTDWNRVKKHVSSWHAPPLLIYENDSPRFADAMDGFYAWVRPSKGFAPDGSDWGGTYLKSFYRRMKTQYLDKIAVGGAWPGFDDTRASWGLNRHIARRCGQTMADSLRLFRSYYDNSNPLPFVMIATWNDYEEGTAIERGISDCGTGAPSSHSAGQ